MSSRSERVVLAYLQNVRTSQNENTGEVLDDAKLRSTISEVLDDLYPPYINSKLRNLDTNTLMPASSRMVKHFGDSSEALFESVMTVGI